MFVCLCACFVRGSSGRMIGKDGWKKVALAIFDSEQILGALHELELRNV